MQHSYLLIALFINCGSDYNPRSKCSEVFKERAPTNLHVKYVRAYLYHSGQHGAESLQLAPEGLVPPNNAAQHSELGS